MTQTKKRYSNPEDKTPMTGERPICGAKRPKGRGICRSTFIMSNGRCRVHGGLSPKGPASASFKDGKHSKYLYMPERMTARVEQFVGTVLENIEESIRIQQSLEAELLSKIDSGESPDAWRALRKLVDEFNKVDGGITIGQFVFSVGQIADGALGQDSLTGKIQSLHETQRKLTETLTKCRREIQETYTQEQWNQMLNVVANVMTKAGPDAYAIFDREMNAYRKLKEKS